MTATMMRMVDTGGELGFKPKIKTRIQTPKPPAAPSPTPPNRPPRPMQKATANACIQKVISNSMVISPEFFE